VNEWSQMQIESWVQCELGEHSLSLWQLKYGDNVQEVNDVFGVWEVNRVCEEWVNGLVVNQSFIETFVLLIITLWKALLLLLLKFWVKTIERTEYIITIWYKYCKYLLITNISFNISVYNININNNNLKK
jgi:hypothetical protein